MKKKTTILKIGSLALCALLSMICLFGCNNGGGEEQNPPQGEEQNPPKDNDNDTTPPADNDGENQTPPPSGDEKKYTDVFIFMGQSNMSGQGNWAESIPCTEGHGYEYRPVSGNDVNGWLYPVKEPFGTNERNDAIKDSRSGGLVSSFCESYYQTTGIPVTGVSASISGSSITQWLPGQAAYDEAVSRLNSCITYITENTEMEINSVNMVWCQGESDGWSTAHAGFDYAGNLVNLFNGLHSEAQVEKCFIITPSIYSSDALNEDKALVADIQANLCVENENFVLAARKFEEVPLKLRDDPHFYQGVYNVAGWEAGANAGAYRKDGVQPECKKYQEGEAEALAEQFGITLSYNQSAPDAPKPPVTSPDGEYNLPRRNSSNTAATPGVWTYWTDPVENFVSAPYYNNGTVTMDIASKIKADEYYVRYQPDFAAGTLYTAVFTVKFETNDPEGAYIVFGSEYYSSKYYQNKTENADGSLTISYTGTVGTSPFMIRVNTNSETIAYAVKMILTDISFTANQTQPDPVGPDEPDDAVYDLEWKNSADTVANPGVWAYYTNNITGSRLNSAPAYNKGTLTVDIGSKVKAEEYYVRYQPDFAAGTSYTAVFTVKFETDDPNPYIVFGSEYYSSQYYQNKTVNADGSFTIKYTGTVGTSPFMIRVNTSSETSAYSIKMTLTGISFKKNG